MKGLKFLFLGWSILATLSRGILAEIPQCYYEKVEQIVGAAASRQRTKSSLHCSTR